MTKYPIQSRRRHLRDILALGAMLPIAPHLLFEQNTFALASIPRDIHIFSKHLHWLDYPSMAKTVAKIGFDGVDLTVRPKGHVLPQRVSEDLPKAVEAIRKAGLKAQLITTAITSVKEPDTETILKTASKQGIKIYRMGWLNYLPGIPIPDQLEVFKKQLGELVEMNKYYGIQAAYQNHAGTHVGSSLWDIWYLIKDFDPTYLGVQFDIRHAMVESQSAWAVGLKLLSPYINSLDIKDFNWSIRKDEKVVENVPIGKGIVDFESYISQLENLNLQAPLCLHLEYPLGGADEGEHNLSIPPAQVTAAMKTDLQYLKKKLNK